MRLQGHAWRKTRAQFRAQSEHTNAHCWLCGQPIDYQAPHHSPFAFEPDHAIPKSIRPDLAWEVSNLRPSHAKCNRKRQDDKPTPVRRSYQWTPANW